MLAELRTISLCDSDNDLFMQTYNAMHHRKSSDSSHSGGAAASCYSGTESQQSVSEKSFYDNVDRHHYAKAARNYLMPPTNAAINALRNANVNRSVSFQDATSGPPRRTIPIPRTKNIVIRRRNAFEIESNRSSVSRAGSSASKSNVDSSITCKSDVQSRSLIMQDSCSVDSLDHGPFYVRVLRRMQKLSFFWRRKRKKGRGRLEMMMNTN